jgi:xanthine dehydrogenase accessory factor
MTEAPVIRQPIQAIERGSALGLIEKLKVIHSQSEMGVLGIIFATEGSTYQKPGSLILFNHAGLCHGAISGGCLEPELEKSARTVYANRQAITLDFDTRSDEDLVFGSGTGCRGRVRTLLLPQPPNAPLTQALCELVEAADDIDLRLVIDDQAVGSGCAALSGKEWRWAGDGNALNQQPPTKSLSFIGSTSVNLKILRPPRVLLLGAGPELPALYLFSQRMGWIVIVAEHRGRWLKYAHEANVQQVIELPPDEAAEIWRTHDVDAAVLMTHNYGLDLKHLAHCARSGLSYVGLLGPAARRDGLLAELGDKLADSLGERLHAPVGLNLGGSGPEMLALSIVAQLQQHFVSVGRLCSHKTSSTAFDEADAPVTRKITAFTNCGL